MASPATRPLPALPLEIQHEVLRFCDPSSLGRTAQVSLAFLQLSSPLLYRDVSIEGMEKLERFFSTRIDSHNPRMLSSLRHLQTFTFSDTRLSILPPTSLVVCLPALRVDQLSLFLPFVPHTLQLPPRHQLVQHLLATHLLPRFAPVKFHVEGIVSHQDVGVENTPSLCFDHGCWTELTTISFLDATTSSPLRDQPFKNVALVTEFSASLSFEARWHVVNSTLDDLFGSGTEEEGSTEALPGRGIERVEIWVDSEERKEELLGIFRREALVSVDESSFEGRLSRIRVKVRS